MHWEDEVMARDRAKDAYLIRNGLHVHRIDAEDIYDDADEVAKSVWLLAEALAHKKKQESPPPRA